MSKVGGRHLESASQLISVLDGPSTEGNNGAMPDSRMRPRVPHARIKQRGQAERECWTQKRARAVGEGNVESLQS